MSRKPSVDRLAGHLDDGRLHDVKSLATAGFSRPSLGRAVAAGRAIQYARGIYASVDTLGIDDVSLAALSLLNPQAVVCMSSAARVHGLGDEDPTRTWLAVDRALSRHHLREDVNLPVTTVWWTGIHFASGIETRTVAGVRVMVTDPARTVVDLVRYRGKITDETAMKALHDYVATGAPVGDLWDAAKAIGHLDAVEPFVRAADVFKETMAT